MLSSHAARIVIAEDEPASLALLVRQLTKAGYDVIGCADGQEALEAIREVGSCIVLADWMMPRLNGVELCRTVRALNAIDDGKVVYFILLTAHTEKSRIIAGLEAGADDYLTKPYHPKELLARLWAGERVFNLQTELLDRQRELATANEELEGLNAQLERLANTDVLTDLANRRHFLDRFESFWSAATRHDRPLGCIMFDIDRFKSVNDTFGHAAGDQTLKAVAQACQTSLRKHDFVGRIGGEEFCVACVETDAEGLRVLAERIRAAVAEVHVHTDTGIISPTISVGAAARSDDDDSDAALMAVADKLLYLAKENGRNQAWVRDETGHSVCCTPTTAERGQGTPTP